MALGLWPGPHTYAQLWLFVRAFVYGVDASHTYVTSVRAPASAPRIHVMEVHLGLAVSV